MQDNQLVVVVEAYSLFEFCQKVQQAVQQGYVFDFESNARFPTSFGSFLTAGMIKQPSVSSVLSAQVVEESPEVLVETQETKIKPTRVKKQVEQ